MTDSSIPVFLLDVDGVLNAPRAGWSRAPRRGYATDSLGTSWPIRWEPAVILALSSWHNAGVVEVRWCSTWCSDARALVELTNLLGMPTGLRAEPIGGAGTLNQLDKIDAAVRVLTVERRPLIWADDDAIPGPDAPGWHPALAGNVLLVVPNSRRGLREETMRILIPAWLTDIART